MRLHTRLFGQDYVFENLYDVMAKANEEKSGDELAGIAGLLLERKKMEE